MVPVHNLFTKECGFGCLSNDKTYLDDKKFLRSDLCHLIKSTEIIIHFPDAFFSSHDHFTQSMVDDRVHHRKSGVVILTRNIGHKEILRCLSYRCSTCCLSQKRKCLLYLELSAYGRK